MRWPQRSKHLVLVLALATLALGGCGSASDASSSASVAPFIEAARTSLRSHQDGLIRSAFRFRSARCREDGGVVRLFEQSWLLGSQGTAFALSDRPDDDASVWAGGFAPVDPATDAEIRAFFSDVPEVACR